VNTLHIVQGGIENGDKAWLERAARRHLTSTTTWVIPQNAAIGDEVVVYVGGFGFFATARVNSTPVPKKGWPNRYGSALARIRLIKPAISLATIRRHVPELTWAIYPRSITTATASIASRITKLISTRVSAGVTDLGERALSTANIDELRSVALLSAKSSVSARSARTVYRARSSAIRRYILCRANGQCESCRAPAPFLNADGSPYLEPHHITRLADEGPDHPARVIGLCPNCHRRAHYAHDAAAFNRALKKKASILERRAV
jgi:hypothetical protein